MAAGVSTSGTSNDALVQSDGKVIQAITNGDGSLIDSGASPRGQTRHQLRHQWAAQAQSRQRSQLGSLLLLSDGSLIVGGNKTRALSWCISRPTAWRIRVSARRGSPARGVLRRRSRCRGRPQKDGKIVAAGWAGTNLAFARFNSSGSADISFDSTGKLQQNLTGNRRGDHRDRDSIGRQDHRRGGFQRYAGSSTQHDRAAHDCGKAGHELSERSGSFSAASITSSPAWRSTAAGRFSSSATTTRAMALSIRRSRSRD